jgi:hypothetical protein
MAFTNRFRKGGDRLKALAMEESSLPLLCLSTPNHLKRFGHLVYVGPPEG